MESRKLKIQSYKTIVENGMKLQALAEDRNVLSSST